MAYEGIYKWNSIGLTIAVIQEGIDIEFPESEIVIEAYKESTEASTFFDTPKKEETN